MPDQLSRICEKKEMTPKKYIKMKLVQTKFKLTVFNFGAILFFFNKILIVRRHTAIASRLLKIIPSHTIKDSYHHRAFIF